MRAWAAAAAAGIAIIGSGHAKDYINGLSEYLDHEKLSGIPLVNGSINLLACVLAIVFVAYAFMPKKTKAYVLDFSVFSPPESWTFHRSNIRPLCEKHGKILPEHIDFLEKIAYRCAGDQHIPRSLPSASHCT
eukprot:GHUV01011548.1.p1 GENE.GHUV01011548.1~~GHUV01011548.1.p1  ORF type:complete len:133 (+),score=21.14 GHUV01011548.1:147-545(+)